MKNVNAIVMGYSEFEKLINEVSDGHAGIGFESNEWFFVADDEYDIEYINKDLSEKLGVTVADVRIDTSVDADDDDVIIICK